MSTLTVTSSFERSHLPRIMFTATLTAWLGVLLG